jgi:hypothetical protein
LFPVDDDDVALEIFPHLRRALRPNVLRAEGVLCGQNEIRMGRFAL